MLIIASTDLQKEIVESGRVSRSVQILNPKLEAWFWLSQTAFVSVMKPWFFPLHSEKQQAGLTALLFFSLKGAATIKEFYAKNSRWTEGLISAAKAVGWGATEMVYVIRDIIAPIHISVNVFCAAFQAPLSN